jgi:hypothetical protein
MVTKSQNTDAAATAKAETTATASEPSDLAAYKRAIALGKIVLSETSSKAAAAREIFAALHAEHRDVVLRAFIEGATVTPKGAPTYYYNINKKFRKAAAAAAKQAATTAE